MILGGLVGMLVLGLLGLIGGWVPVAKNRAVRGIPARFIGLIALLPWPTSLLLCYLTGFFCRLAGIPLPMEMREPAAIVVQLITVVAFVILISILSYRWSDPGFVSKLASGPGKVELGEFDDEFLLDDPISSRTRGMARASLMLGIFSLLTSLLAAIPAFILGGLALRRISMSGGRIAGKGAATAGISLGVLGTFTGLFALALLLPFLKKTADPGPDTAPAPFVVTAPNPKQPPTPPPAPVVARVNPEPKPTTKKDPRTPAKPRSPRDKTPLEFTRTEAPTRAIETKPEETGTSLANKTRKVSELKVTDLKVDAANIPRCLLWGEDGRVVFILETDGTLRRVAVAGLAEELKWEIGQSCSWLSLSSEGLVLTVNGLQEVWLLDPRTFEIKTRTPATDVVRADSSPAISFAFATKNRRGDLAAAIDLKAGKITQEYTSRSFPDHNVGYDRIAITPDGKRLYAEGMERLQRFDLDGENLIYVEESDRIAQNGQAIEISPDGAFVALPSGGGNYGEPRYSTFVYRADHLAGPEFKLTTGPHPKALAFDIKASLIYAQSSADSLILFQFDGTKLKSYRLAGTQRDTNTLQILAHPDGRKLFHLSEKALSFVEISATASRKK